MDFEKAKRILSVHEGRKASAYQDSLGYWTIGVGHLIDARCGGRIPDHIIDALLDYDIDKHWQPLVDALPWIKNLDPVRQYVLLDMAFNLGVGGLLQFRNTLHCVREGNYEEAAERMGESLWARQVKTRAVRLRKMMRSGQWPEDIK